MERKVCDWLDYERALARLTQATARRDARNANIGFAVAGGLAIGALVTFLTGH